MKKGRRTNAHNLHGIQCCAQTLAIIHIIQSEAGW